MAGISGQEELDSDFNSGEHGLIATAQESYTISRASPASPVTL
jgi:hypothetical protein